MCAVRVKKPGVKFGIELRPKQNTERDDVEPEEKRDAGTEGAINLRVVGKTRNVPTESQSGEKPQGSGEDGTRKDALPRLLHGRSHVIDQADDPDTANQRDAPAYEKRDGVDRGASRGNDVHREPLGDELTEDDNDAGQCEGNQRERDKKKSPKAPLEKGPAVGWEIVGPSDAFHQRGENAGSSGEADDEGDYKGVGGTSAVWRVDEVTLQQWTDVGGKNAVEESGELKAQRSVIREETDNCRGDDERGKERHHGGVGSGLSQVETVVAPRTNKRAVENAKKA